MLMYAPKQGIMLKYLQVCLIALLTVTTTYAQKGEAQLDYIEDYKDIAMREMDRAGIPASIKLAQGILESNAGQSNLARRAKNHFGIKCGANWKGGTVYKEDDDYDENGKLIKSCFRAYKNSEASYVAHSEFLRDPRKAFRYGFLFRLDPKDYKRWAHGLKKAGYATSATYPEKLISLIERYELYQYDNQPVPGDPVVTNPPTTTPPSTTTPDYPTGLNDYSILQNNDVRYVVVNKGESLDDIAKRADESVKTLIAYNDNINAHQTDLQEGDRIYIQPKRNSYRGRESYHRVKAGETMFSISQEYGIKLSKLYRRNRMEEGKEPAVGEDIKIRGWKVRQAPKLSTYVAPPPAPNAPEGELEFEDEPIEEDPIEEVVPTKPQQPTAPVKPENTNTNTNNGGIIINPGSQPVSPPPTEVKPTEPTPTPPAPTALYHTVQKGDTLYAISRKYNTTVDAIKSLNGLTSNNIALGQQLRVK